MKSSRLSHSEVTAERLRQMYWDQQLPLIEVGKLLGISESYVGQLMARYGVGTRSRSEALRLAIKKERKLMKREANPFWKGGRTNGHGYVLILMPSHKRASPSGYVYEHILVWEQAHGRPLPKGWIVHHLNGIKDIIDLRIF